MYRATFWAILLTNASGHPGQDRRKKWFQFVTNGIIKILATMAAPRLQTADHQHRFLAVSQKQGRASAAKTLTKSARAGTGTDVTILKTLSPKTKWAFFTLKHC
jgi:hypothetical protein